MTPPVMGLIGGIGAGKSAAAKVLAGWGLHAIDCDALGHAALERPEVREPLVARWGSQILTPENRIDRRAVARIVFADPAERQALESVIFPVIRGMARAEIDRVAENALAPAVVLDAAVLLEAGWHNECSKVAYIDASYPVRLARVQARSGWTAGELAAREASQWPTERKKSFAHAVIPNDGTPDDLAAALKTHLTSWNWPPFQTPGETHA